LDNYKDDEGKVPPVRSWIELEKLMEEGVKLMEEGVLRDSVELVGVH